MPQHASRKRANSPQGYDASGCGALRKLWDIQSPPPQRNRVKGHCPLQGLGRRPKALCRSMLPESERTARRAMMRAAVAHCTGSGTSKALARHEQGLSLAKLRGNGGAPSVRLQNGSRHLFSHRNAISAASNFVRWQGAKTKVQQSCAAFYDETRCHKRHAIVALPFCIRITAKPYAFSPCALKWHACGTADPALR